MNPNTSHDSNQTDLKSTSLLSFLYRRRKIIIVVCAVAAVVSIIASLLIEEKYKSTVIMFAAKTNSIGKTFLSDGTMNNSRDDILGYGETEEAEQLLELLNSEKIRRIIIDRYDLFEHYDIKPVDGKVSTPMLRTYSSNINSELTQYGAIQIEVMDKSPDTAMYIANDIASLVDSVSNYLKKERAQEALKLAQQEQQEVQNEIAELEARMAELRDKGVYDYLIQIEGLNELYATARALGFHDEAEQLKAEMAELSKYGNEYEHLKTLISAAYEQEELIKDNSDLLRFDVNSQVPAKFVINHAQIADGKAYPIRWLIVVMSVISTFVFTVILLLVFENYSRLQSEQQA